MPPSSFGARLAEARKLRELTQEQLGEKADIPSAVISHFETGVRGSASADNLVKLADALRVSVDYLLGRADEMTPLSGELERRAAKLTDGNREVLETFIESLARSAKRGPGTRK
jgi:transcriptional regulator with XRE-family HTH domain